jgi:hypothetical protein
MDGYGDWYRRTRPPIALKNMPGINTVSNASHNVVIDFFAFGGFPLLITYLVLLALGIGSIIRVLRRDRSYNPIFVALSATWACYQAQSLVSINQIGLAIWGWVLTGLIIAFERATRPETNNILGNTKSNRKKTSTKQNVFSPPLISMIGVVAGLFIASPPLNADSTWYRALNSHNATVVEKSLQSTFMMPEDSYRYAQAVNLFSESQLPDQASKYARKAVEYNPDYFPAWKQLYYLANTTAAEKKRAIINMQRLDPLNPDVTAP